MARKDRQNWWQWEKSIKRMHEQARNTPPDYKPEQWLTVPQAMQMLGLSRTAIEKRIKEGCLNAFRFHPREQRHLWREDVEWEKRRLDSQLHTEESEEPVSPSTIGNWSLDIGHCASPLPHDHWISAGEALAMLDVSRTHLDRLVRTGKLHPRQERPFAHRLYDAVEVEQLANQRLESAPGPQHGKNLRAWGSRARMMDTMPEADWITAREAAEILGVGRERISDIADAGLLPVYQREPGKRGSRLYFPRGMVVRLRDRPERLAHRARWEKAQLPDDGSLRRVAQWEDMDIQPVDIRRPSASTDKERGDRLTTRQVALLLGVHPSTVHLLRNRGRLTGHHAKPHNPLLGGNRWWFFDRAELDCLLADPDYAEHCRRYKKGLRNKAERIRAANDPAEIARQAEACLEAMRRTRSPYSAEWWEMHLMDRLP